MTPNKLDNKSIEGSQLRLEALYAIAPSCFTEVKDPKTGETKRVVNFATLRTLLGDDAVETDREMYQFTWPGKQAARLEAAVETTDTLRPVPKDSVNWDTTENLYIEGDNLRVLKLLQKSYLGKVKMIYIDPPYNTGNDFVYHDDFARSAQAEDLAAGNIDLEGYRYRRNTDSNGRFHSDWCSMMLSRLLVAHSLLAEDGVIFISIDDNEVHNLRKICDEVFGERNFVANICHKSRASVSNDRIISENHNHILFYSKNFDNVFALKSEIGEDPILKGFNLKDDKGEYKLTPVDGPGGAKKGNPYYEFLGVLGYWRYSLQTMTEKYNQGLIVKTANNLQQKFYRQDAEKTRRTITTWWDDEFLTSNATRELINLMGSKVFDSPKNINLLLRMLRMSTYASKNSLILDFFSGSATTAHAVMQLNAEDLKAGKEGNRKYICVQLAETTPEDSEARKAGYTTIPEIAKERIRRAGKKIVAENPEVAEGLDTGFRVFKLDSSNFEEVSKTPNEYNQTQLDLFLDNIKTDRTDLDLLFGAMLSWGVSLSLSQPLQTKEVDGCTIYNVTDGELVACFAKEVTEAVVRAMAAMQPERVLFRDSCFAEDKMKINLFELFKQELGWDEKEALDHIRVI
ncbi:site-specific DNA-methyltransferase [Capnocytophaga canimorsus]|uniref:site-specific DNA-methyltransferase (adenine-specific) n=1 Tax=Capnocytophaga canimorsus TaxID=28188 RepID=A0A0B7IEK0_9FLAO|nr:site-specific DNA-methyltransferase [Capnocytophaga canimorsus]CEN50165.1 DNA (Cytosine-5-)-methyltransferase [Capnocytophaga canimorsus]